MVPEVHPYQLLNQHCHLVQLIYAGKVLKDDASLRDVFKEVSEASAAAHVSCLRQHAF
jgi:hypothetical protein